jgi:hypothetical protein
MVILLKGYGLRMLSLIKRFLANQPANPYESIVFNAVRMAATQFGTGRIKPA